MRSKSRLSARFAVFAAVATLLFAGLAGRDERVQPSVGEQRSDRHAPVVAGADRPKPDVQTQPQAGPAPQVPQARETPEAAPTPVIKSGPPSGNAPKAPPPVAPTAGWPRKMGTDPATGYVLSPAPKVRRTPRIIAWFPIGNSDTTPGNRRIGWNIKKDGWAGFVDKWVEPALKLGFDAVQLHNPAGTRIGEEMQPDQFLDAKDDGADWVSRGFVEAWRPVTQRVQVIAYLGMLPKNDRFEGFLSRGDRAGFLQCLVDSYRLPLDARMDIAFDAMHTVKPDGWEVQVYRLFTAMGVKTYIEPIPNVMDKALYDANFEIMNLTLERALTNGEPWVAPLDQLTGERIILVAEPPKGKDWKTMDSWLPGFLQHWTSQGWSVAMSPTRCIETGTRPRDLLRTSDRQPAK